MVPQDILSILKVNRRGPERHQSAQSQDGQRFFMPPHDAHRAPSLFLRLAKTTKVLGNGVFYGLCK